LRRRRRRSKRRRRRRRRKEGTPRRVCEFGLAGEGDNV